MASPWKFFARIMSPRRKQEENVGLSDTRRPIDADHPPDAVSQPSEGAVGDANHVDVTIDVDSPEVVTKVGPPRSLRAEKIASFQPKHVLTIENETRTRKKSRRKAEAVEAGAQSASHLPSGALDLDQEINVLRKQLANRLHLQNAQLKDMLKRFER